MPLTLYALTLGGARDLMRAAFKMYPANPVRLIPYLEGYVVQVLPEIAP
jgi:hypothetical protein